VQQPFFARFLTAFPLSAPFWAVLLHIFTKQLYLHIPKFRKSNFVRKWGTFAKSIQAFCLLSAGGLCCICVSHNVVVQ
jgi:hypothetical protein